MMVPRSNTRSLAVARPLITMRMEALSRGMSAWSIATGIWKMRRVQWFRFTLFKVSDQLRLFHEVNKTARGEGSLSVRPDGVPNKTSVYHLTWQQKLTYVMKHVLFGMLRQMDRAKKSSNGLNIMPLDVTSFLSSLMPTVSITNMVFCMNFWGGSKVLCKYWFIFLINVCVQLWYTGKPLSIVPGSVVQFLWSLSESYFNYGSRIYRFPGSIVSFSDPLTKTMNRGFTVFTCFHHVQFETSERNFLPLLSR
jgi:hypothetical protein